jgi:multiple sugar transport system ATP-binding protein
VTAAIALAGIRKVYPNGKVAIDGLDLEVDEGEFVVLLGPTGCGKSTVLRIVAGLERATAGTVHLGGRPIDQVPTRERRVAMVFQEFALYPHLTVAQNIAFPLHTERHDEATVTARAAAVAGQLRIADLLHRRPAQLSGGQRQRVAIARAIVRRPAAFLLDEPLSNVDAAVRAELRAEIVELARSLGVGTIYVTHDQTEAMTMADKVAVLRCGRIEQVGTPNEVYADPQRLFVAAFLGIPRTSLLEAAVYANPGAETVLDFGAQVIAVPWTDPRAVVLANHHTARITAGIRSDALRIVPADTPGAFHGKVSHVENLGNETIAAVNVGGVPTAMAVSHLELPDVPGGLTQAVTSQARDRTRYGFYPIYDPATHPPAQPEGVLSVRVAHPATPPRVGDPLALAVDLNQVFLFDHQGDRIRLA